MLSRMSLLFALPCCVHVYEDYRSRMFTRCTGRLCSQVRIEDDVICGTDGPEVISSGVPSDVAAVEQLVGSDAQPLLTPM
jgi:hypothetical protein